MKVVEMLDYQDTTPYYQSEAVDEVLRTYPMECTRRIAVLLYTLGYIEGKRAERDRKKKKGGRNVSKDKSVV